MRINTAEEIVAFTSPENRDSRFPRNIGAYLSKCIMPCLLKP
jgi:hypothetical protein